MTANPRHRSCRPGRLRLRLTVAGTLTACALAAPVARAQDTASGPGLRVSSSLAIEQSYTETRARPSGFNGSEFGTRVSPGVRIFSRSGRVQGSFNYTGSAIYRSGLEQTKGQEWLNALDASFTAEAVPNWAYVDARASISQQSISAFGRPASLGTDANANRTEVSTLSLSPYVRGTLGKVAEYQLRLSANQTDSRLATAPDSNSTVAALTLNSARRSALFGWGLSASRQRDDYTGASRPTETDRVNAQVSYVPDPELRFTVNAGKESTDVAGAVRRSYDNYGASVQWSPSQRTSVLLQADERYFGRSHRVSIQHRQARSVWSYSDTRDVSNGGSSTSLGQPTTLYQLFYEQFAAQQPDPALRDQMVLDFLALIGRSPNEVVAGGALTPGITLQRRQDLALALQGIRTTLSLQAFRSESRRIDAGAAQQPGGDENVVQTGYTASLSHRLTPTESVSVGGSRLTTAGTPTRAGTNQKAATASLTSALGRRTSATLRAGYTVFNSPTDPSRQTSVAGSVSLRF